MEFKIVKYQKKFEDEWDRFIFHESCNGTFLQTRKFLNYHPEGKYTDSSLLIYEKDKIVAVCPACEMEEERKKIFVSHAGSTYGGIVISQGILRAEKLLILIDVFEAYIQKEGFAKCILKQTNSLLIPRQMELLEYCLYYKKYKEYKELNLYIDFNLFNKENIIENFSKLRRRIVKKCIGMGMELKSLTTETQIERLIDVLKDNLEKYNLKPYHSVKDLLNLKIRFPDNIEFWGCVYNNEIVAISMIFLFESGKCAHAQYLAADSRYDKESPMTYIYYKMIDIYKDRDIRYLSWGITSEHLGIMLNENLTNTKEEYGSSHNITKIYEKMIS